MHSLTLPGKTAALVITSALISGCLTSGAAPSGGNAEGPAAADRKVEPCEAIATLTQSYTRQFADIRRAKRSYNRIDIWSTPYQVVGNNCEIWGWPGGHFNYVCHYVAPDENSAREIYGRAHNTIHQCLDPSWTLREAALQDAQDSGTAGSQAVFEKEGLNGVIDLRLMQTRGINKPRWAVYMMIGDYNSQL